MITFEVPDGDLRAEYTFTPDAPKGAALVGVLADGTAVWEPAGDGEPFTRHKRGHTIQRRPYRGVLPDAEPTLQAAVDDEEEAQNILAGLDFASDNTAENAAKLTHTQVLALRTLEPSGKGGYTAKDLTRAKRIANRTEET